jgi:delta 1-pyrroline-5-carboxylate dehydrogenase
MEEQFRSGAGAGFSGAQGFGGAGFSGFGGAQGMTLEELVRKMQEQADARRNAQGGAAQSTTSTSSTSSQQKRVNDKVGDYVDFEEVE